MIEIQNAAVIFNKGTPLEKIGFYPFSLQINVGELVVISGNNGVGKSTLLNLLSGSVKLSAGKIFLDRKEITDLGCEARADEIAYVPQDPRLGVIENFTIEENLAFASKRGRRRGLGYALKQTRISRFKEHLARFNLGLEDRLQESAGLLSGGQRQALSLAMATLSPCKLLLLDEVTASLDQQASQMILQLIQQLNKEYHLTILMVTHSKDEAQLGTCTINIRDKKIIIMPA